jgi:hypothetical protein
LLRQWYYMSSLKFFIWNFVTGNKFSTNWATIRNEQEYNLPFRCRRSLREHSRGTGQSSTLVMSPEYYGRIFRKNPGWIWTKSSQNGFLKQSGPRNQR